MFKKLKMLRKINMYRLKHLGGKADVIVKYIPSFEHWRTKNKVYCVSAVIFFKSFSKKTSVCQGLKSHHVNYQ